ncbi:ATP-binding protein [candidate division KSB1 bacterium]
MEMYLPSNIELLPVVEGVTESITERLGFDEQGRDGISISVIEAASNAIIHGNKHDLDKEIVVSFHWDDDSFTVKIKDSGQGFDPDKIPDPLAEENILRENGRGIFLIRSFMSDVKFHFTPSDGTTVELIYSRNQLDSKEKMD